MGEKQERTAETNQKWQKTDKNHRKTFKMWIITNYISPSFPFLTCQAPISDLPSSHFCPAKLSFLSCQALISVLPSSHFCPAKLPFLSCQALAQNFLNLFKLPHLFDFDPILSDLWPVECKRSCFETPSKMQNL